MARSLESVIIGIGVFVLFIEYGHGAECVFGRDAGPVIGSDEVVLHEHGVLLVQRQIVDGAPFGRHIVAAEVVALQKRLDLKRPLLALDRRGLTVYGQRCGTVRTQSVGVLSNSLNVHIQPQSHKQRESAHSVI